MKNIGILTWYYKGLANFGQTLQCFALQETIKQMGYNVSVFRYRKPEIFENVASIPQAPEERFKYESFFRDMYIEDQGKPDIRKYLDFIDRRLVQSEQCYNSDELRNVAKKMDAVMLGADQLWNYFWYDPITLLPFAGDNTKKIAYATGGILAPQNRKQKQVLDEIAAGIGNFDAVSVREEESSRVLKEYYNIDIPNVLDPVLLHTGTFWNKICSERVTDEKYIFFYSLGRQQPHKHIVREIAKRKGITKVLYPRMTITSKDFNDDELFCGMDDVGPEEFLSLIRYADCVVTDSFHALCFSVLWEKQFYMLKRADYEIEDTAHFRIENIMSKVEISDRYIYSKSDLENKDDIDYISVAKNLDNQRKRSFEWLKTVLEIGDE